MNYSNSGGTGTGGSSSGGGSSGNDDNDSNNNNCYGSEWAWQRGDVEDSVLILQLRLLLLSLLKIVGVELCEFCCSLLLLLWGLLMLLLLLLL